jgi:hypothetical protein
MLKLFRMPWRTFALSEEAKSLLAVMDAVLASDEPWNVAHVGNAIEPPLFNARERRYLKHALLKKRKRFQRDLLNVSMQKVLIGDGAVDYYFGKDALDLGYRKSNEGKMASVGTGALAAQYQNRMNQQQIMAQYQNAAAQQNVLGSMYGLTGNQNGIQSAP